MLPDTQHLSYIPINSNQEDLDSVIFREVTKIVLPNLSNDLDIAHLRKFKHLESNVLEHYPVETKIFGGHPVEYPEDILINDFGENLSKLHH